MRRHIDPLIFAMRDMAYGVPNKFIPRAQRENPTEMVASYKKYSHSLYGRVYGRYFDMKKRIAAELVRDDTWNGSYCKHEVDAASERGVPKVYTRKATVKENVM